MGKVAGSKKLDLFSNSKKKPSRTASPVSQQSRSRSRSPVARSPTARSPPRSASSSSRSPSPPPKPGSRADSPAVVNDIHTRTISSSPTPTKDGQQGSAEAETQNGSKSPEKM